MHGVGTFSKIGTRNAMVISVAALAMVLDEGAREVRVALGSVGPVILRAPEAEQQAAAARRLGRPGGAARRRAWPRSSAGCVAAAARPIDDVRGSAAYRRHAVEVLARRSLAWCAGRPPRRAASGGSGRVGGALDAGSADGQRRGARGGRLGRGEPAVHAPRTPRAARFEERLRTGRVRVVLGVDGRRARVLVPGAGGAGRGARGPDGGGAGRRRRRSTRCSRRSSTRARCSAGSARRG